MSFTAFNPPRRAARTDNDKAKAKALFDAVDAQVASDKAVLKRLKAQGITFIKGSEVHRAKTGWGWIAMLPFGMYKGPSKADLDAADRALWNEADKKAERYAQRTIDSIPKKPAPMAKVKAVPAAPNAHQMALLLLKALRDPKVRDSIPDKVRVNLVLNLIR